MNNCGLVCRGVRLESRFQRAASSMANMGVISGMHALPAEQVRGIRVESAKTVAYRIGSCKQCRSMCGGSRSDVRKQEALRQGSKEERSNHGVGWIEDARNVQEVSSNPEACALTKKSSDRNLPCFSNTHTLYQSIQVPVRAQRSDPWCDRVEFEQAEERLLRHRSPLSRTHYPCPATALCWLLRCLPRARNCPRPVIRINPF